MSGFVASIRQSPPNELALLLLSIIYLFPASWDFVDEKMSLNFYNFMVLVHLAQDKKWFIWENYVVLMKSRVSLELDHSFRVFLFTYSSFHNISGFKHCIYLVDINTRILMLTDHIIIYSHWNRITSPFCHPATSWVNWLFTLLLMVNMFGMNNASLDNRCSC